MQENELFKSLIQNLRVVGAAAEEVPAEVIDTYVQPIIKEIARQTGATFLEVEQAIAEAL